MFSNNTHRKPAFAKVFLDISRETFEPITICDNFLLFVC